MVGLGLVRSLAVAFGLVALAAGYLEVVLFVGSAAGVRDDVVDFCAGWCATVFPIERDFACWALRLTVVLGVSSGGVAGFAPFGCGGAIGCHVVSSTDVVVSVGSIDTLSFGQLAFETRVGYSLSEYPYRWSASPPASPEPPMPSVPQGRLE